MTNRSRRLLLVCSPLLILALAAAVLAALTLSLTPLVPYKGDLDSTEVRQVEQWIVDNSPSSFQDQGGRDISLTDEQLNLLSAFAFSNIPQLQAMSADFDIDGDHAHARLTIPRKLGPVTVYLNIRAQFAQAQGRARVTELHAGRLPIPRSIMRSAEQVAGYRLESASAASRELAEARHSIVSYELGSNMLHLRVEWEPEVLAHIRNQAQQVFLSEPDRARILAYHTRINLIATEAAEVRRQISLHAFIPELYELAHQRSSAPGADPVSENRSLLQALSFFVNDMPISQLVGRREGEKLPANPSMIVMLYQRHDLSRHFVSAAAIAASAGVGVAEVLANSKEVHDARYGTGFSFSDMAANLAGVALGESSTDNPASARRLQERLMNTRAESDYMPTPRTELDGLDEDSFLARFGDRSSDIYLSRLKEIEEAVFALPVYRSTDYKDTDEHDAATADEQTSVQREPENNSQTADSTATL